MVIGNSVTSIGELAFCSCNALTSITIPDSVTEIGELAFSDCSSLESVTFGDGIDISSFWDITFKNCPSLKSFYGKYASDDNRCLIFDGVLQFFAPAGLTTYHIPNSVDRIMYYAFFDCNALTSITIPDSVFLIGDHAFSDCAALTSVYCKATTPPTLYSTFSDNLINIYVPTSSVDAYKTAEYWSNYADKIVGYDF